MRKNRGSDTNVLFVNAETMFGHSGNKNVLRDEDIEKIYGIVEKREDVEHVAYLATRDEIVGNDYVLSVGSYVSKEDTKVRRSLQEIQADLDKVVAHENELRAKVDALVAGVLGE
jgi:type I restriction enzyme M protein